MTDHWLILGTGANAERHLPKVKADCVITANGGLALYPRPDYYWISDPAAVEIFRHLWEKYDGPIISNEDLGRPTIPVPFDYRALGVGFHGRTSCTLCAHIAIIMGATRITFVGHEGYPPEAVARYKDGSVRHVMGKDRARILNESMSRALENMAIAHPQVEVTICSPTHLRVPGTWQVIS